MTEPLPQRLGWPDQYCGRHRDCHHDVAAFVWNTVYTHVRMPLITRWRLAGTDVFRGMVPLYEATSGLFYD